MLVLKFILAGCLLAATPVFAQSSQPQQVAQLFNRPPRDVPLDADPAQQDNSALVLRIDRLETQLRTMTGQVEQLQFQQRKLEEAMRKMQADTELRFRDAGKVAQPGKPPAVEPQPQPPAQGAARPRRPGGDAFEPDLNPAAPGAPRPIGSLPAGEPSAPKPVRVVPLPGGPLAAATPDPDAPVEILKGGPQPVGVPGQPPIGAAPAPAKPRDEYDAALALYRQGQYEPAEVGLRGYLQKNPAGRQSADAVFFLGETYFQRQRNSEAAEQYLKLTTDFAKATKAPDGLVRLGMALNALGAREQACAAFGEVARKHPDASAAIRGAERESKRAHC